jgi:hypothetical protein
MDVHWRTFQITLYFEWLPQGYEFCLQFHICFLLDFFFDPEDGGDIFLQNVRCLSADSMRHVPDERTLNPTLIHSFVSCIHSLFFFIFTRQLLFLTVIY